MTAGPGALVGDQADCAGFQRSDAAYQAGERLRSALLGGRPFPPVDRVPYAHVVGGHRDVAQVAKLPEILGGTGVLEQHMVDLERVKFAATVAVDRHAHVRDEFAKARFVILRHYLACSLPLRLFRHKPRLIPNSWDTDQRGQPA
jgi:hypothetical protein